MMMVAWRKRSMWDIYQCLVANVIINIAIIVVVKASVGGSLGLI